MQRDRAMVEILWEFEVRAEAVAQFEEAYGAEGVWAQLFRAEPGYRGTTLLRDTERPRRYVTIDRWDSLEQYLAMHERTRERYASERPLGTFRIADAVERPA
jgi:heme-degrading monooxygenase HmoA